MGIFFVHVNKVYVCMYVYTCGCLFDILTQISDNVHVLYTHILCCMYIFLLFHKSLYVDVSMYVIIWFCVCMGSCKCVMAIFINI